MLSKAQSKYIRSLAMQKFRKEDRVFLAEGDKIAREWLQSKARIRTIVALPGWANQHGALIAEHPEAELVIATEDEIQSISSLQAANQVLLVVHQPEGAAALNETGWVLALDGIRDPGNMGTLLRIADWFGIPEVVCSPDSVEVYNPKVVQSAMGAHLRVQIRERELPEYIRNSKLPAVAATLQGENLYRFDKPAQGILVIGNESKGISDAVLAVVRHQVTIPRGGGAESLNAAVSAGILCALLLPH